MSCLAMNSYTTADSMTGSGNDRSPRCEADLVAEARSGHSGAFEELCRRHAEQVFRVTLRITRKREDAEDALQDSLVSALVHIRDFDGRSRFSTWLTRIAINSALMLVRTKRNSRVVSHDQAGDPHAVAPWLQIPDSAPDPEVRCLKNEYTTALRAAIQELRPAIRQVIELGHLEERPLGEIAEMMAISVTAAKARAYHARAALRRSPQLQLLGQAGSRKASRVA